MKKRGTITDIRKEHRGYFMFEPCCDWVAYCYREQIAQARTKKECIRLARERGYSVPNGI